MLKELYNKIISHKDFTNQRYLAHFFAHLSSSFELEELWSVGFYDDKRNLVVSYKLDNDNLIVSEGKPFKKAEDKINELKLDKLKIDLSKLKDISLGLQRSKYPGQDPIKIIVLLQNISFNGDKRNVWNLTFITQSFATLNMKIDADNGDILSHELTSLMQWRAG